jgi:hypothetical protein
MAAIKESAGKKDSGAPFEDIREGSDLSPHSSKNQPEKKIRELPLKIYERDLIYPHIHRSGSLTKDRFVNSSLLSNLWKVKSII